MRAKLANLNHCAVPFLSRASANLSWYYNIIYVCVSKFEMGIVYGTITQTYPLSIVTSFELITGHSLLMKSLIGS